MTEKKPKMKLWKKILIAIAVLFVISKIISWGNSPAISADEVNEIIDNNRKLEKENEELKNKLKENNIEIPETEEASSEEDKDSDKKDDNKVLGIDDEWVVDGQWKLKILGVTPTEERNQYSEKDPAQVVVISYTYENIGFEDEVLDGLFLTPDTVIDESGSVGYSYPNSTTHHPENIPAGAKVEVAEDVFGLDNESSKVKISFSKYDSNRNKQKATFEVPVN